MLTQVTFVAITFTVTEGQISRFQTELWNHKQNKLIGKKNKVKDPNMLWAQQEHMCIKFTCRTLTHIRGAGVAQAVQCLLNTGWTTGRSGFDPRQGQRIFPLVSVFRRALEPTQPPMGTRVPFPGSKPQPGRDADQSTPPPLGPRSWLRRRYTSSPPFASTGVLWDCFTFLRKIRDTELDISRQAWTFLLGPVYVLISHTNSMERPGVLHEKLIVTRLVKCFPFCCGTCVFTRTRQRSPSWTRRIQSAPISYILWILYTI
jgi:hypothetical protein